MAYAHSRGVIHRDLKPSNVMVGSFGEVFVVDWGLAKVIGQGSTELPGHTPENSVQTHRSGATSGHAGSMDGAVMGTLPYMPPEQAQGKIDEIDERADVFSLGAILCEILTGSPPYEDLSDHPLEKVAAAELGPAHDRLRASGADDELVQLAEDCLQRDREVRPSPAGEVARRIATYLEETEARAEAERLARREAEVEAREQSHRHRQQRVFLVLALLGLAFMAWLMQGARGGSRLWWDAALAPGGTAASGT